MTMNNLDADYSIVSIQMQSVRPVGKLNLNLDFLSSLFLCLSLSIFRHMFSYFPLHMLPL